MIQVGVRLHIIGHTSRLSSLSSLNIADTKPLSSAILAMRAVSPDSRRLSTNRMYKDRMSDGCFAQCYISISHLYGFGHHST